MGNDKFMQHFSKRNSTLKHVQKGGIKIDLSEDMDFIQLAEYLVHSS
jgi:hypothetical protein